MREYDRPEDESEEATTNVDEPEDDPDALVSSDDEFTAKEPLLSLEEQMPEPLLSLEDALKRIPDSLRKEMEDLLRAEFKEVRRWKQGNRH